MNTVDRFQFLAVLFTFLGMQPLPAAPPVTVVSPDGRIRVELALHRAGDADGVPRYRVLFRDTEVVGSSRLGIVLGDGTALGGLCEVVSVESRSRHETYSQFPGKRREVTDHVQEKIVVEREFENKRLQSEEVAEFNYRPTACRETYRMVVVRKNISVEKGEKVLFDDIVYFFYLTNDWLAENHVIVLRANGRCHQENVLAQLHGGVRALQAPVDNLVSNWAYMVMTALAWNLKAWWALTLPEGPGRGKEKRQAEKRWVLGIEFKTFVNAFVRLPCQIVRTGRKLVFRLLAWNPYQPIFFRLVAALRC